MKLLKQAVMYLENFHFAYTAVLSKGTNRIDSTYSAFAIKLRNCNSKQQARDTITLYLIEPLDKLYPGYSDFENGFVNLIFSKKDHPSNVKTKYAINKIDCYYRSSELFSDTGSIEHIFPEGDGMPLNIGNLILLENELNVEAGDKDYVDKKTIYGRSSSTWVKKFCEKYTTWDELNIEERAKDMAYLYYTKILNRPIEPAS